jgi:hypothetical protein
MMVDVMGTYALGVCISPRLALYPSCDARADMHDLPRGWQHPCVRAMIHARPYVCG